MTDDTIKAVRVENGAHFWVVDSGENDGDTRTMFLSPPRADIKNGFPWTQYVVPTEMGSDGVYVRYDKAIEVDGNPAYQINASEEAEIDERCEVVDCNVAALQRASGDVVVDVDAVKEAVAELRDVADDIDEYPTMSEQLKGIAHKLELATGIANDGDGAD